MIVGPLLATLGQIVDHPGLFFLVMMVGLQYRERHFRSLFVLVMFTVIYNIFLKSLWKVPLSVPLEGWAFPSGHMHVAVVFWSRLLHPLGKERWRWGLLSILLALCGYSLVFNGYHYPRDILGSVLFGSLSCVLYSQLETLSFFKQKSYRLPSVLVVLATVCFVFTPLEVRKPVFWQILGGLVGFVLGWGGRETLSRREGIRVGLMAALVGVGFGVWAPPSGRALSMGLLLGIALSMTPLVTGWLRQQLKGDLKRRLYQ